MNIKTVVFFLVLISSNIHAQTNRDCVAELLKISENFSSVDTSNENKTSFISYKAINTDWENQTLISNVKMYKNKEYMNFYSEQGIIYSDDKNAFLVLPMQKLIVISSITKGINNAQYGTDFLQYRSDFFDSCEVISCVISAKDPSIKTLELKVKNDMGGAFNIVRMIYNYNVKDQKLLSVIVYYNDKYKAQRVEMILNEMQKDYAYKFMKAHKYVLDKKGNLQSKYSAYELMDNRDNNKK